MSFNCVQNSASTVIKFWINAVCINQNDSEEKEEQIQLMGNICHIVERVWAWLCPADGHIDVGLEIIRSAKDIFNDDEWIEHSEQDPPYWDFEWMKDAGLSEYCRPGVFTEKADHISDVRGRYHRTIMPPILEI